MWFEILGKGDDEWTMEIVPEGEQQAFITDLQSERQFIGIRTPMGTETLINKRHIVAINLRK